MLESDKSLAAVLLRGRVDEVRGDVAMVRSAVGVLLRIPVTNGGLVKAASDDVQRSLRALEDSVSRLTAAFV